MKKAGHIWLSSAPIAHASRHEEPSFGRPFCLIEYRPAERDFAGEGCFLLACLHLHMCMFSGQGLQLKSINAGHVDLGEEILVPQLVKDNH